MPYRVGRPCPACGGAFDIQRGEGLTYDTCRDCSGVWISWVMLLRMANELDPGHELEIHIVSQRSARLCPECRLPMRHSTLFEISVDCCLEGQHGVYFDKDELLRTLVQIAGAGPSEIPDAGEDAGAAPDAGAVPDAGEGEDAGAAPDAGEVPEAGEVPDAGAVSDAGAVPPAGPLQAFRSLLSRLFS